MQKRMNWEQVNFDWNQARAFLATALEGSLSAAARKLKQTQPTLSRQVAALEAQLGVTLFERVGKQLVLTETGNDLLDHVRAMGEAAGMVSLRASGHSQAIVGEVRIAAGDGIASYVLPPIIERLRATYPEIVVDVVAENQLTDLKRREADIAIRHVRPTQPDLFAKKIKETSASLYAAKSYLKKHPVETKADLQDLNFIGSGNNQRFIDIFSTIGLEMNLGQFKVNSENTVVGWEMVRRGLGVGGMLDEIAAEFDDVERLLPDVPSLVVPFWLCTHRELHTSRRIRLVFDLLAESLQR